MSDSFTRAVRRPSTLMAGLLLGLLLGPWISAFAQPRPAETIPNAAQQRQEVIAELKRANEELTKVNASLTEARKVLAEIRDRKD